MINHMEKIRNLLDKLNVLINNIDYLNVTLANRANSSPEILDKLPMIDFHNDDLKEARDKLQKILDDHDSKNPT